MPSSPHPVTPSAAPAPWLRAVLWHVSAFLLVLLLPVQSRHDWPVWEANEPTMLHAVAGGIGYLMAALLTWPARERAPWWRALLDTVVVTGGVFAAIGALPLLLPELPLSRSLLLVAGALTLLLLVVPLAGARVQWVAVVPLVAANLLVVRAGALAAAGEDFTFDSQSYLLGIRVHRAPAFTAPDEVEGGGLARLGDELLLVTGAGHFVRLVPGSEGAITATPLGWSSPANAAEFRADAGPRAHPEWFRVVDLLAERVGDSVRVTVSHHQWDRAARCFTLRVSRAMGGADLRALTEWRPVFDTQPCLPIRADARGLPFAGTASGGRMLRLPDGILLTVGDHQLDGLNSPCAHSQDRASHYGKTVLLPDSGTPRLFTIGHRNPQGLARDSSGRLWTTEHGPKGGDELNRLRDGANYGWPYRTLGTEYGLRSWPLQRPPSADFVEPAFAFVPSPGVSSIHVPGSRQFPAWKGSLLVGSLKVRELLRVQLDGDRPVYVEELRIGYELRDVDEAPDGTLVLWTDQGAVLTIRASDDENAGASLASQCVGCHTLNEGQQGALGPNLHGIVGRKVAAKTEFPYSDAMRALGGRWTPERLDAFLANPQGYVPGTAMAYPGIRDSVQRRLLVEYLQRSQVQVPRR